MHNSNYRIVPTLPVIEIGDISFPYNGTKVEFNPVAIPSKLHPRQRPVKLFVWIEYNDKLNAKIPKISAIINPVLRPSFDTNPPRKDPNKAQTACKVLK